MNLNTAEAVDVGTVQEEIKAAFLEQVRHERINHSYMLYWSDNLFEVKR